MAELYNILHKTHFMDIHELLNWNYLTSSIFEGFQYERQMAFVLIAFFLLSIMFFVLARKKVTVVRPNRKLFAKIATFLFLSDLYGGLLFFSRLQTLPFLSMRIVLLTWVFLLIMGFIWIGIYVALTYRQDLKAYFKEELKKQYLPRKNK